MVEEMKDEELDGIETDEVDFFDHEPDKMEKLEVSSLTTAQGICLMRFHTSRWLALLP